MTRDDLIRDLAKRSDFWTTPICQQDREIFRAVMAERQRQADAKQPAYKTPEEF